MLPGRPYGPTRRALLSGAAATLAACGTKPAAPKAQPLNVLLVTLCSVRADRIGASGYRTRNTTPSLDALAARGVRFDHAWANGTWTNASHASLLTGLIPGHHRVEEQVDRLVPGAPTLPGLLGAAGWRTAALLQEQGAMTLDARSDLLRDVNHVLNAADIRTWSPDELVAWIERDPAPFFALVTLREAHLPFGDGAPFTTAPLHPDVLAWRAALPRPGSGAAPVWENPVDPNTWIRARTAEDPAVRASLELAYDSGVAAADVSLGRLLAALDARGLLSNTVVVVVADHGEAIVGHKDQLSREVIRVPMVIVAPGLEACVIHDPVAQVDVLPTLVALAGIAAPKLQDGQDLGPALRGEALPASTILTQSFVRGADGTVSAGASVVLGGLRGVQEPGRLLVTETELADGTVRREPWGPTTEALALQLHHLTADTWLPAGPAAPIPEALRDGMRARGYW